MSFNRHCKNLCLIEQINTKNYARQHQNILKISLSEPSG